MSTTPNDSSPSPSRPLPTPHEPVSYGTLLAQPERLRTILRELQGPGWEAVASLLQAERLQQLEALNRARDDESKRSKIGAVIDFIDWFLQQPLHIQAHVESHERMNDPDAPDDPLRPSTYMAGDSESETPAKPNN